MRRFRQAWSGQSAKLFSPEQYQHIGAHLRQVKNIGKDLHIFPIPQAYWATYQPPQLLAAPQDGGIQVTGKTYNLYSFLNREGFYSQGQGTYFKDADCITTYQQELENLQGLCAYWGWQLGISSSFDLTLPLQAAQQTAPTQQAGPSQSGNSAIGAFIQQKAENEAAEPLT